MNETLAIERPDAEAAVGDISRGLSVVSIAKSYDKKAVLTDVSLGGRPRRGARPARPERRRQDHLLLFDHGPGEARQRPHPARRRGHYRPAHVPPRHPRPRLSAAGNLDLPRPDRRAEHHGACSRWPSPTRRRAPSGSSNCSTNSTSSRLRDSPGDGAVGRRAAALRDRPRAGRQPLDHAARRAVRRHRPDLDPGHSRPDRRI